MRFFEPFGTLDKAIRVRGSSRSSPDLSRGDPDGGSESQVLEDSQPLRVQLIRLMHVPHHLLRHLGMRQERDASSLFDLIHDPVPVAHGFQGDRRAWREAGDESPDSAGFVVDPGLLDGPASVIENGEEGVVLAACGLGGASQPTL